MQLVKNPKFHLVYTGLIYATRNITSEFLLNHLQMHKFLLKSFVYNKLKTVG